MSDGTSSTTSGAGSSVLTSSAVMAAGTAISRVSGYVRSLLLAAALGTQLHADVFTIANTVPNMLYILLAGGVFNAVLVPQLVRAMKHDADGGDAYTNRIITLAALFLAGTTAVLVIAAPVLMRLYLDDAFFTPELAAQRDSVIDFARFCLPQIFFYGMFVLVGQVLNARNRFGPMMWAPIANNVISVAVLLVYLVVYGAASGDQLCGGFDPGQEWLLGLGSTLGIVAQFCVLLPYLRAAGFRYRPRFDFRGTGLGHTMRLGIWTLGFVVVNQVAYTVVVRLASSGTALAVAGCGSGSSGDAGTGYTIYSGAFLLVMAPHSIATVSLATATLPLLSRHAADGDTDGVARQVAATTRTALALILPFAAVLPLVALPLSNIVWGYAAASETYQDFAVSLALFAPGLVFFTVHYLMLRGFYSLERTRTVFLVQCVIAATNIVLALVVTSCHRPAGHRAGPGPRLRRGVRRGRRAVLPGAPHGARRARHGHHRPIPGQDGPRRGRRRRGGLGVPRRGARGLGARGRQAPGRRPPGRRGRGGPGRAARPGARDADPRGQRGREPGHQPAARAALMPPDGPGDVPPAPTMDRDRADSATGAVWHTKPSGRGASSLPGSVLRTCWTSTPARRFWRATDLTLARNVAIHVVSADDPRAGALLTAARTSATVSDGHLLRVLDAVEEGDLVHVVHEWGSGVSLDRMLAEETLEPRRAAWLVREVAEAITVAHRHGIAHGRLLPENVMVTDAGSVQAASASSSTRCCTVVSTGRTDTLPAPTEHESDVLNLGALLYASLTGKWPGFPESVLPDAPFDHDRVYRPRRSGAGVPKALDALCDEILNGDPHDHGPLRDRRRDRRSARRVPRRGSRSRVRGDLSPTPSSTSTPSCAPRPPARSARSTACPTPRPPRPGCPCGTTTTPAPPDRSTSRPRRPRRWLPGRPRATARTRRPRGAAPSPPPSRRQRPRQRPRRRPPHRPPPRTRRRRPGRCRGRRPCRPRATTTGTGCRAPAWAEAWCRRTGGPTPPRTPAPGPCRSSPRTGLARPGCGSASSSAPSSWWCSPRSSR